MDCQTDKNVLDLPGKDGRQASYGWLIHFLDVTPVSTVDDLAVQPWEGPMSDNNRNTWVSTSQNPGFLLPEKGHIPTTSMDQSSCELRITTVILFRPDMSDVSLHRFCMNIFHASLKSGSARYRTIGIS